ncbi:L-threonylcarbamoyladenylate synthase [Psychrobium sp. 1_MG-2023]|uniref:L-threonylcarbamoyladenylate synthase n=1 Tax=Psychrobium sp. 1_MG-2023 TaxID=3062624 RepID=UPI000C34773D|nr:L-threonylcarbamoyladenylate synthase [Psychrobium sp. 1_MG-2023]MDP2560238.1 L-threonylcarbamoyladenylate synthase [Psychrobium sp. 1_MG-2023]PKF57048.1 threonylcarbamoyl-AMP synthase [Alteromonadales bacterium alter-6D02]
MSQFFYVHPENPQQRLIDQAIEIINKGGVIIYPTDSGYAIGCQLDNKGALERICRIRDLDKQHNFTLMCSDLAQISNYAKFDNQCYRALRNNTPGGYTFIFRANKEVPKRVQNPKRKTIGLRVPDNKIAHALLDALGEPILSTSLILPGEDITESDPELIRDKLEKHVDLIVNGGHLGEQPTTVIDMSEGSFEIIRVGAGDPSPFE